MAGDGEGTHGGVGGRGKQFTLCRRGLAVRGGRGREREGDPWLTMFLALDLYPKSFTGRPCAAHSPENLCVYLSVYFSWRPLRMRIWCQMMVSRESVWGGHQQLNVIDVLSKIKQQTLKAIMINWID